MSLPDIPRLYTALAEWLACTMYLLALRPRFGRAATLLCSAAWLAGLGIFLQLTGNVPLAWWIPCMVTAVAAMFLYIYVCCSVTAADAGYCCARAFILAEFAASLEWQLHCMLWPELGGGAPPALLLLAARCTRQCTAWSTGWSSGGCGSIPRWASPGGRWPVR